MKKIIIIIAALFLISASTINIFKPATPRFTRHKLFTESSGNRLSAFERANRYIGQCVKDGYIIKTVAISNGGSYGTYEIVIVVAEKY